ncbi:MAG: hypothetical protein WCK11_04005 [Candidatus Falkowbacteria bacterium]
MLSRNDINLEMTIEKKLARRAKRKRKKMPVSGAGVKKLQRLIVKKSASK